jgi:hypothetical protein
MNQNTSIRSHESNFPNEKCVCMKIFALGDQGNLLKGIDNKTIKALTKQAGPNVIGLLVYSKLQAPLKKKSEKNPIYS